MSGESRYGGCVLDSEGRYRTEHAWELTECDGSERDEYTCQKCGLQFTERCTFDEEYS